MQTEFHDIISKAACEITDAAKTELSDQAIYNICVELEKMLKADRFRARIKREGQPQWQTIQLLNRSEERRVGKDCR